MKHWLQTYKPELSETLRLSIPIVIAQLGVVLMGVTDNIFVGRLLGPVALGAAGLAVSLTFLISSIGVGGLAVVASLVSQARGQNDPARIHQLHRAGIRVALLLSAVLGLVGAGLAWSFGIFRQTPQVTELARNFMLILSVSNIPLFLFVAARQLCDGLAYPRVAMGITLSALLVNALFNWLLILGVGPFPEMGLYGSATATLISRIYMAVAILVYIHRTSAFQPYFREEYRWLPIRDEVRQVLRLGLPGGMIFFFEVATFSLAQVMVGWLGEVQLAAHQIALNMASTTYMMATGISSAGAIRVGNAVGRQSRLLVRRAGVAAFVLSAVFMSLCALLFLTANDWLVSLYIRDNPEVMTLAASLLIMAGIFQLSDGIQVVGVGALRGLSDVNVPTIITLFAYWVVAMPVSYLLGIRMGMGAAGVWVGLLVGLSLAAVLLTMLFFRRLKRVPETKEHSSIA